MLVNLIDAASELPEIIVSNETLFEFEINNTISKKLCNELDLKELDIKKYTSSIKTSEKNFAILPNQYFSYACVFFDFSKKLMAYFDLLEKFELICERNSVPAAEKLFGSYAEIKEKITSLFFHQEIFENESDINLFCKFLDQNEKTYRLGAKSPINNNDGYSIRAKSDCFGSVILTRINLPNASSSIFGDLVFALANSEEAFANLREYYLSKRLVKSSNPTDCLRLSKQFILLSGISGTGKSRYVREQAAAYKEDLSNYCLIPVHPDWHESSDLLGYVSGIGRPRYKTTEFLGFIVAAWKNAFSSADKTGISLKPVDQITPYWLCLDEMNLAPVEQYFADYLAVIETREWKDNIYKCHPLLKAEAFNKQAMVSSQLRKDLELNDTVFDGLWEYFSTTGIPLPPNLIVAGTVNMDETTHGFSRKVIDRAFSIDFGAFFPNDFSLYFGGQPLNKKLSFPILTSVSKEDLQDVKADPDGAKSMSFMSSINDVLANTPFELAYRALNELLLSVVCFQPETDIQLQAVWDDFLMTKVLPRIEGDAQKLQVTGQSSLLIRLTQQAKAVLNGIWDTERPDLLRSANDGGELLIPCRSKQKLSWMEKRLSENEFTSFWP